MARFRCFRKGSPNRLPPTWFLCPTPVRRLWHLWIQHQGLVPTVGLVASTFDVLLECCLSWRNVLHSSRFLCEEQSPGIVHFRGFTRPIVHQDHKSLQQFHWFVTGLTWHALKLFESIIHLRERLPRFPGGLLSSASECRYGITAGERVKYWESQIRCWIHCGNHFMNSYVPKVCPNAKRNPELIRSSLAEWSHSQYHDISINSAYGHLLAPLLHSICSMQK